MELTSADGALPAEFDPGRLEQVLLNLANNALAHAPDSPRIEIPLAREADEAVIADQDFRPGIPPADLPRIFEQFHRSPAAGRGENGGLGLGLFLAREIVQAHGRSISAFSAQGQGATFVVWLRLLASSGSRRRGAT